MKDDSIVQFVGFETAAPVNDFTAQWEQFARRFFKQDIHTITLQQQVITRSRYKYISTNEWRQDNFQFSFMGSRESDYFPDHRVKVVQTGGYTPFQLEYTGHPDNGIVQILAFVEQENANLNTARSLPHQYLNIFEQYYQSCLYAWVLDYYVLESEAQHLVTELKRKFHQPEVGLYKECLVLEG